MGVQNGDIRWYAAANGIALDDTATGIGGAIDTSHKPSFSDLGAIGTVQVVSSNAGDTTQTLQVYYRDATGVIQNETKTLNGQTPVAYVASMERLLRGLKNASTSGDVALEAATAERTGTAQAGGTRTLTLDAGASGTDGIYAGMILRITGGAGAGQIREIVQYAGSTKVAEVDRPWGTAVDGTSVFRVSRGFYFEKSPNEILTVTRVFYNAAADQPDGADRYFVSKIFAYNTLPATGSSLSGAIVKEVTDTPGIFTFALEASLGGSTTNGGGNNRQVPPTGLTFDSANKNVANGQVLPGQDGQAVWVQMFLVKGASPVKTTYVMAIQGTTV